MRQSEYLLNRIYVRIWLLSGAMYALSTFETVSLFLLTFFDNNCNISAIKSVHKISNQKGKRIYANYVGMLFFESGCILESAIKFSYYIQ